MQLQTNTNQRAYRPKVSTILLGLIIVFIPIMIGVLMNMPQVLEWVKISWKEIAKGGVVGFSILPVVLFTTIKGGTIWYKRWWTWGLIGIAVVAVVVISLLGSPESSIDAMKGMSVPGEVPFY